MLGNSGNMFHKRHFGHKQIPVVDERGRYLFLRATCMYKWFVNLLWLHVGCRGMGCEEGRLCNSEQHDQTWGSGQQLQPEGGQFKCSVMVTIFSPPPFNVCKMFVPHLWTHDQCSCPPVQLYSCVITLTDIFEVE